MLVYMSLIDSAEDQSKFEKIYLKYRNLMFYIANRILNSSQDSEDAVHNAFIKIADNIHKIDDVDCSKTKAFVATIVEHTAIDFYREKKRSCLTEELEDTSYFSIDSEGGTAFAMCMAKMPPRYRQILVLKYSYGFSNKEASKIMDISEANAIKLDQRAKKRLRELCKEEGVL